MESRFFKSKTGKEYEIIGTKSTGWRHTECQHLIKSKETGKRKLLDHADVLKMMG